MNQQQLQQLIREEEEEEEKEQQQQQIRKENDVTKVKAPETARNMRALFESGNVKGISGIRKILPEEEIANQILTSGAGVESSLEFLMSFVKMHTFEYLKI